jgi:hypothetical protein
MVSALPTNSRLIQAGKALWLRQQFRLEGLQAGGQRCPTLPDLPRPDQPKGRILGEPRRVVQVFIARQPAIDRLSQQIGQR